jgi:cardiolipin synthase C
MGLMWLPYLISIFVASPEARSNQLRYIDNSELAISQLYQDIRTARQSIDMTYYIWDLCHVSSQLIVNELAAKARQGVKVRILFDGIGTTDESRRATTEYFRRMGIEIRYFSTSLLGANNRNHAKITLVDGQRFLSGGRNIADDYFGLMPGLNWMDREVHVEGPAARQASTAFGGLWNSRDSTTYPGGTEDQAREVVKGCPNWSNNVHRLERHLRANAARVVSAAPTDRCSQVETAIDTLAFAHQPPVIGASDSPSYMQERIQNKPTTRITLDLIRNARSHLLMENYVYIPPDMIDEQISRLRERRVPIELYSNSFRGSTEPVAAPHTFYMRRDSTGSQRNLSLSRLGSISDRWALTPRGAEFKIHSKVFVADGRNTFVSSFNIDPRSYHTNVESGVLVRNCPAFAERVIRASRVLGQVDERDRRECAECRNTEVDLPWNDRLFQWLIHELL